MEIETADRTAQHWRAREHTRNAGFVADLAADLIDVLDPRPGQRVLDVGCGDGGFSMRVRARGADVVGIDSAPDMVRSARSKGLNARVCAAQDLCEENEFDLAVSNAVFHWIPEPRPALSAIHRALRPGAKLVGELGGKSNIATVIRVLAPLFTAQGIDFSERNPWNFPDQDQWSSDLHAAGFTVLGIELFERPTPLPTSFGDWIDTFANGLLAGLDVPAREDLKADAERAAALLRQADGTWVLDYVRLRFTAVKPISAT